MVSVEVAMQLVGISQSWRDWDSQELQRRRLVWNEVVGQSCGGGVVFGAFIQGFLKGPPQGLASPGGRGVRWRAELVVR